MINPMELQRKRILVTGASSGIGRATCIIASQLGATVSLVARDEERLLATMSEMEGGKNHRHYCFDLKNTEEIEELVKQMTEDGGAFDGMVNCAGIGPSRPIKLANPGFVLELMQSNYCPFVELVRVLSKKKFCNEGASFIGVSSVAAFQGGKTQGAYAATKAAISGIVKPMAKELSVRNIRVNSVAFGMIRTGAYQEFLDAGNNDDALRIRQYLGIGEPEDAANAICFLLSNASRFITGTTMIIDGGYLS